MERLVCSFNELSDGDAHFAGGKGGTLARLYQKGYPVPDGFIIMPEAFVNDELAPEARAEVLAYLGEMRKAGGGISFAVRSSALGEDSSAASFAGQFKTVLDVRSSDEVLEAVKTVHCRATRLPATSEAVRTST